MATALMQAEGYRSELLGRALEDARLAAGKTASVELQCEAVLSSAPYFYSTGRNRDYIALADQQPKNPLDPAHLSGLWATKGIAHYNRGEIGLAVAALRQAQTLSEGIEVNHRVLVG
jgi:hypothetical protein